MVVWGQLNNKCFLVMEITLRHHNPDLDEKSPVVEICPKSEFYIRMAGTKFYQVRKQGNIDQVRGFIPLYPGKCRNIPH